MTRALKRPDGWVVEEAKCTTGHLFENGKLAGHDNSPEAGDHIGVFWFEYLDTSVTRRYTRKTAPAWLLALYIEATEIGTR